jgi:tetratricopeptide (TPR) repeat protein
MHSVKEASSAGEKIQESLSEMTRLSRETADLKKEVETMRDQLRSSDALLQGKLLYFQQKYAEAAEIFDNVFRSGIRSPDLLYWLGLTLLRAGDARRARPHLASLCNISPRGENLRILGEAEFRLALFDEAEEHLKAALSAGIPNQEETQQWLGQVQLETNRELGKSTLRELVERNPFNGVAVSMLAEALSDDREFDDAISLCNKALGLKPQNWVVVARRAEIFLSRGGEADLKAAQEDIRALHMGNPRDFNLYRIEGKMLIQQAIGQEENSKQDLLARAEKVYRDGIKLMPSGLQAPLYASLSFVQILGGENAEAEKSAKLAVQRYDHLANHLALCGTLIANKRWPALQRAAQKARNCGGRLGRIYSHLYDTLGALCAGNRIEDISEERRSLSTELREMPRFKFQRADWPYIRENVVQSVGGLTGEEQLLGTTLTKFCDQTCDVETLVSVLESKKDAAIA